MELLQDVSQTQHTISTIEVTVFLDWFEAFSTFIMVLSTIGISSSVKYLVSQLSAKSLVYQES